MIDLLRQADPAAGAEADAATLRAAVAEKLGGATKPTRPMHRPLRRGWAAAFAFAAVAVIALLVATLRPDPQTAFSPSPDALGRLTGVVGVTPLASGGVQTAAVDGDTIWVMGALSRTLQQISTDGQILADYSIDSHVEGVSVGGSHLWLLGYDNGGEILRFDPGSGEVDRRIPLGGAPHGAARIGDTLFVNNEHGDLFKVSIEGEIERVGRGEVKGRGLGFVWVSDPDTGLLTSFDSDGNRGELAIQTTMAVRTVVEADGRLWLLDGDYPWGTNLWVFDPKIGELNDTGAITFGLLDLIEFDGSLWVTSHTDHLIIRVDPSTMETHRYPMPGKVGGLLVADGSLWATFYHPAALVRLAIGAGQLEQAPIVADDWDRFPHRLLCTGVGAAGNPTVLLEPYDWIDYGSWSVIQAELSELGYRVCVNGYLEEGFTPDQRAADLAEALDEAGIAGPYLVVAAGDGVFPARLFTEGREDVAGVVLVDPWPIGLADFWMKEVSALGPPPNHEPDPALFSGVGDLGDIPLVVIGQDPQATFQSSQFNNAIGRDQADLLNDYWQDGLQSYARLSTQNRTVLAPGTGFYMVIWDRPELVVDEIVNLSTRSR